MERCGAVPVRLPVPTRHPRAVRAAGRTHGRAPQHRPGSGGPAVWCRQARALFRQAERREGPLHPDGRVGPARRAGGAGHPTGHRRRGAAARRGWLDGRRTAPTCASWDCRPAPSALPCSRRPPWWWPRRCGSRPSDWWSSRRWPRGCRWWPRRTVRSSSSWTTASPASCTARRDAGSLAERTVEAIRSPERNRAMGEAARARYERDFLPSAGVERLVSGYRAAMAGVACPPL